jgi:hypothetical protein
MNSAYSPSISKELIHKLLTFISEIASEIDRVFKFESPLLSQNSSGRVFEVHSYQQPVFFVIVLCGNVWIQKEIPA